MIAAMPATTAETIAAVFSPPVKASWAAVTNCSPSAPGSSLAETSAPSMLSEAAATASAGNPSGSVPAI